MDAGVLQIRRADYADLLQRLASEGHPLAREVALWKWEELLEERFARIAAQAQVLATQLGKGPIEVCIEHGGIRVEREPWARFWAAFFHAVRNAMDHGLETPAERHAKGKGTGTLTLRAYFSEEQLVLELHDDGRGIAWEGVQERARSAGLPAETPEALLEALCSDGVSTRYSADEQSGRGVGMAALQQACAEMGGTLSVESAAGRGTLWRFAFPEELGRCAAPEKPRRGER